MAQEIAIAKAALSASLFRADPASITRPAVDGFFALVGSTLTQCSRPNIQKCKAWIVDNIVPSQARTAALGRFLAALSRSLDEKDGTRPSVRRRRLHVLYIVNDVAHHVTKRLHRTFGEGWETHLPALVAAAANFENCPKHMKKLEGLIDLWDERGYFGSKLMGQVRTALAKGAVEAPPSTNTQPPLTSIKLSKETPYVLPSLHGDPSTPWYDLPASTWLPHMEPNSTRPMLPDLIRPIQLAPGPADKQLAVAVQDLLDKVEVLFSKEKSNTGDGPHVELSELGDRIVLDEITGEVLGGETYYGWSQSFCKQMKERKKKTKNGFGRGRSSVRSRSSSYSRDNSRSFDGRRAESRSPRRYRRSRSYSRSPSRSRSPDPRSPKRYRRRSRSLSRSRSRSRSRQLYRDPSSPANRQHPAPPPPPPPPPIHQAQQPPFPPIPPPGDLPFPPPPAGYHGPWPPPPPSGAPQNWLPQPPGMIPPHLMGRGGPWGSHPPPPPPPPPQPPHHYQGHHGGRGGRGGFRGRGRGW